MKKGFALLGLATLLLIVMAAPAMAATGKGFNEFGYNYSARIFNGPADGVDKVLDGKVWGDPTYANDQFVMKWNAEWDRGNAEAWAKPPYAAWETNEWNGKAPGGSGWIEHVKIIWVGADLETGPYWRDGGYPIWGQFEVIMDQGLDPSLGRTWWTHATPAGFGRGGHERT